MVGVLLLIFVLIIPFLSNPNPAIDVTIYGPSEVGLGEPFNYTIVVCNDGDKDLFNVTLNDTYGFNWSGNLTRSESKTFTIEHTGLDINEEIIEVYANGYSREGERVENSDSWTPTIFGGCYDIVDVLEKGYVSIEFRGTGYSSGEAIEVKVTPKIKFSIEITIESGLFLINSGFGQNMIIAETITIKVKPKIELNFDIEVYCLDLDKDNPTRSETFYIRTDAGSYQEDVNVLIESLEDVPSKNKSVTAIQIAVWVITEDISREEIPFDYSDDDIDDAKWLLENAGIDTSDKTLFRENP